MTQRRTATMLALAISLSACVSVQTEKRPDPVEPARATVENSTSTQDVLKLNQWVILPADDRTVVLLGAIEALTLASVSPNNPTPVNSRCLLALNIPDVEAKLIAANAYQGDDNFVDALMLASNCL